MHPNAGKNLTVETDDGQRFARFPVRTHIVKPGDDILKVAEQYAKPHLQASDVLFISERIVAIAQGRAFPIKDIRPSWLARFLVKFVHKSPYGIGLGSPWTMELALREAGAARILFAALLSALTKPFGLRGVFYKVAGRNINTIDGPTPYTLPPYNEYAKLGPKDPDQVAQRIADRLYCEVVIIDANDLGITILGRSRTAPDVSFCRSVFRDNPLGQSAEQTPMAIVRNESLRGSNPS